MIIDKRDKGLTAQALVEVALTLPLILLLILGAMDFGRIYHTKIVITNAAREGANYLAYYPENISKTMDVIKDYAGSAGVVVTDSDIEIHNCGCATEPLSVTVTKTIDDMIFDGFLTSVGILDGPITISSMVTMDALAKVD